MAKTWRSWVGRGARRVAGRRRPRRLTSAPSHRPLSAHRRCRPQPPCRGAPPAAQAHSYRPQGRESSSHPGKGAGGGPQCVSARAAEQPRLREGAATHVLRGGVGGTRGDAAAGGGWAAAGPPPALPGSRLGSRRKSGLGAALPTARGREDGEAGPSQCRGG